MNPLRENSYQDNHQEERVRLALRSALIEIFYTETIGHCHVDEAVEHLLRLPRTSISTVLSLVRLISFSVSDLLAFSFMENVERVIGLLDPDQMRQWVIGAMAIYESEGLQPAKEYLANARETALKFSGVEHVVELEQMASRLAFLAAGLTGRPVTIKSGDRPYTDTESIYLPPSISLFPSKESNYLLYRMMAVHKCAQIRYHSFYIPLNEAKELVREKAGEMVTRQGETVAGLECLLDAMEGKNKAFVLAYAICDTIRIEARLERDFPGLSRDLQDLKRRTLSMLHIGDKVGEGLLPRLSLWLLREAKEDELTFLPDEVAEALLSLTRSDAAAIDVARACMKLVDSGDLGFSSQEISQVLPYMGAIMPEQLGLHLKKRRKEVKKRFIEIVGAILLKRWQRHGKEDQLEERLQQISSFPDLKDGEQALAMLMSGETDHGERPPGAEGPIEHLFLDIKDEKLRSELEDLLSEIRADMGSVPLRYISSSVGIASGAWTDADIDLSDGGQSGRPAFSTFTYDEWDFRRHGYRQNWCLLKELEVPKTGGDFVEKALRKHRGQLALLLRQFEMLRPEYRFLKRQAEGEDIDIDAVVEAWADIYAQRTPSEYLFVRQMRRERNIAVLFLVDMSASTQGWINQAIKEALILLCQCLELLDDKYAICGFSGMRRTSCHFFRIKDFDQPYDEAVRSKIGGINPRDYTRMGPAIRHATTLFREVEARLRILVTLSDGKPEDYDEYKGPYAVEDTKKALLEAREEGIKPFCITIDKEARDYLSHMYGEGNYIFIRDVGKLYRRVAEIYRLLTT